MKIMGTSFKRSHVRTAAFSAPNPAAGHHRPMPPLETPGHSRASLGQSLVGSLQNDFCSFPRQTIQYHSNPSLCPTSNAEEAEVEWFYEDLQDLRELTPKRDVLFIIGDWNAKVGSQEVPGVIDQSGLGIQNKVGQRLTVLPRECTGHNKHPLPTTQENTVHMDITR